MAVVRGVGAHHQQVAAAHDAVVRLHVGHHGMLDVGASLPLVLQQAESGDTRKHLQAAVGRVHVDQRNPHREDLRGVRLLSGDALVLVPRDLHRLALAPHRRIGAKMLDGAQGDLRPDDALHRRKQIGVEAEGEHLREPRLHDVQHPLVDRRVAVGELLLDARQARGEALVFGGEGDPPLCQVLAGDGVDEPLVGRLDRREVGVPKDVLDDQEPLVGVPVQLVPVEGARHRPMVSTSSRTCYRRRLEAAPPSDTLIGYSGRCWWQSRWC